MFGRLQKSVNRGTRAEGGERRRWRRRVRGSLFNASGHLINDLAGEGGWKAGEVEGVWPATGGEEREEREAGPNYRAATASGHSSMGLKKHFTQPVRPFGDDGKHKRWYLPGC